VSFDPAALSEVDVAWLAGFFDGEGCIGQVVRDYRSSSFILPIVRLINTHMPVLPYVRAIMDAHGLAYTCVPHSPLGDGRLPQWVMTTQSATPTAAWLTLLLPYLHTKRAQAEEMLAFCRLNPSRFARVSASDQAQIREMYATGDYTQQQLADLFGLAYATVNRIVAQDRPDGAVYHSVWRRNQAAR
jgi:hypothetical protein